MNPSRRLGILGGMFDPVHYGHLNTGVAAERALDLTGLLVVPSNNPPHRAQPVATGFHRFAMVAMAVAGHPGWRALDLELGRVTRSFTSDTLRHLHTVGFRPTELFFIAGADAFLEIATWKDYPALLDLAHFAVVARPRAPVGELPERLPTLAARMRSAAETTVRLKPDTTYDLTARQHRAAEDLLSVRHIATSRGTYTTVEPSDPADHERTWIFLIDAATGPMSSTAIRQARLDGRTISGMVPPSVQQHIEQHALYETPAPAAGGDSTLLDPRAGRLHGQD